MLPNNRNITALPSTSHAKEQQLFRPGESGFTHCNFNWNHLRFNTAVWNCVEQTWNWRGLLYWLFKADACLPAVLYSILCFTVWCMSILYDLYVGM